MPGARPLARRSSGCPAEGCTSGVGFGVPPVSPTPGGLAAGRQGVLGATARDAESFERLYSPPPPAGPVLDASLDSASGTNLTILGGVRRVKPLSR